MGESSATRGLGIAMPAPWIGLLAFGCIILWKAVAHALSVTNSSLFPGMSHYASGAIIGLIGFWMVWAGCRKDELAGTSWGFMGGSFIFLGLVEPAFMLFAKLMNVPPLLRESDGVMVLTPNLLLMQASAVSYFTLLILLGLNKDTRCRMFLWFQRNCGLKTNPPTPGYRRQHARIAAIETVMVSWFFYILIITLLDPRVFGRDHPVTLAMFWVMLAWGLWLVAAKLAKYRAMAPALRYAIPVAGILWFNVELAAQFRWYTEVWVKPKDFPVINVLLGSLFLGGFIVANRTRLRGGEADPAG